MESNSIMREEKSVLSSKVMKKLDPLVSIILPVYNADRYLTRCLDSLVNQTYGNKEIIIVNDGSTDNSLNIIKGFADKNECIRLFSIVNSGAGTARNVALKNIKGTLVMFVDADDWLEYDCIEKCMAYFRKYKDLQCVIFPYIREFKHLSIKNNFYGKNNLNMMGKGDVVYRRLFGLIGKEKNNPACIDDLNLSMGKLYYTRFVEGKSYPTKEKIIAGEDLWFNIQVFEDIKNIIYITDTYYHYNKVNDNSITKTYRKDDYIKNENLFNYLETVIDEKSLSDDFKEALVNRKVFSVVNYIRNVINNNDSYELKKNDIDLILSREDVKNRFKRFSFTHVPIYWSAFLYACKKRYVRILLIMAVIGEKIKYILK